MKTLNDVDLNQKLKNLAAQVRDLLEQILEHIAEVDRRKLFLKMAFTSLFDYLTKEIGYSAGAAQRRIDAARLMQRIPEIKHEIKTGALNLVQISKVQQAFRKVKKTTGRSVAFDLQKEILVDIKNKTVDQTDLTLAQKLNFKVEASTRFTIQRDESVRLELTFSKDEMATIERAREILSHKTGGALNAAILEMARVVIKAAQPKARLKSKVPPPTNVSTYGEPIPSPNPIEAKDKPTAPPLKNYPLSRSTQNLLPPWNQNP